MINWIPLTSSIQVEDLIKISNAVPCAVFKHSTRCGISAIVKSRLENSWTLSDESMPVYYLDLLAFRPISNDIAALFSVRHESPQLLVIHKGACVYHASHQAINANAVTALKGIEN